jgi:hypothetical protein
MRLRPSVIALLSLILAIALWLSDSVIHFAIYREPTFEIIPHDINELWMRIVIFLLIVSLGAVIASSVASKQRALALQANLRVYRGEFDYTFLRLHHLAQGVERNQLTPEQFHALAKEAIQPAVEKLMTLQQ